MKKKIVCSWMLIFTLNLDSKKYCVHRYHLNSGFTKTFCTLIIPLRKGEGERRKILAFQVIFRDKQRQEGEKNIEGRGNQGQDRDIMQEIRRKK